MREVWISIRVGLTPRCDAMIASRWRLMDQERPKFRRAQFLGQLRCLPLCWGFPLSGVALFFRHLRTGHRSCATAIGLPKREVSVPQPRAVYPRFFLPSVVGSQRQWQDAIKAITYSTTRTVESRRSVEVFWEHNGWFWRPRFKGCPADGEAVGPFTTSTQAYESAKRSAASPTTQYRPQ